MSDYICCFNIQCKDGKEYGWTVPVTMGYMPTEEKIDLFVEEIDAITSEHTVINCFAIFDDKFKPIYKDKSFADEDMEMVYSVGLKHGRF